MPEKTGQLAGPAIMILSALIFGYFGYTLGPTASDGQFVLFMALLTWTLRISAALFVLSAVLTLVLPVVGNLLYALVGVVGAGLFVVVAVMDIADDQYRTIHPVLLLIFAVWNGYGSWLALRAILAGRAPAPVADDSPTP
ncbi:MAG: hypothetical protein ACYS15_11095 [Planctomycetota bacterium]|jgi:hypothetical protein